MARPRRYLLPDIPVHLIQRGNNKHPCFFSDRDYVIYLDKLREYSSFHRVAIHSFVLMTNHVHILCTPKHADSISLMMQSLGRYFVRYINSTYQRTGSLWEGRFRASMVLSEQYLLTVHRYIEQNPVRAAMVAHPSEYRWSSYQHNALGKNIKLITPHPIYLALGPTLSKRQSAYRALFDLQLSSCALKAIRQATNKTWVLGDDKFKQKIEAQLGYCLPPFPRGGSRSSAGGGSSRKIKLL